VLTCSCIAAVAYWSSTSDASSPAFAWAVSFANNFTFALDANVFAIEKSNSACVRAVRGGL